MKRSATSQERAHLALIAQLPCVICGKKPCHVHHIREGQGTGQRASHFDVLPLCARHHQNGPMGVAFHAGSRTWAARFGSEREILAELNAYLSDPMAPYPRREGAI